MQSANNITNSNLYDDLDSKVTVNEGNISTFQGYIVSNGTNFGVGPSTLQDLTIGTKNTACGNLAGAGPYGVQSGSRNVMVGYSLGGTCIVGSNNTFLGANTTLSPGQIYISGSIALGCYNWL